MTSGISMLTEQRLLTDKALFDFYMVSSVREEQIYSQFPFYLDKQVFGKMVKATCTMDKLVKRIINASLREPAFLNFQLDSFSLKEDILALHAPLQPFFWVRYDAFQRQDGGIFFSEFNYDKPCAQRETAVAEMMHPQNSPNYGFTSKFRSSFESHCKSSKIYNDKPRIAILVDPGHYEEIHLAYLYIDMLESLGYEFIITGGNNLRVENEKVFAFEYEVDVILRQFPTEFLHEVECIKDILRLFNQGKILIINDPRAIIGQAKNLFGLLWEMVERKDPFLSEDEIEIIKDTVPYTCVFKHEMLNQLLNDKDKFVIKAAFGRYSEEVYIGKMHTEVEWKETLEYVCSSDKLHIVQEFCPIKRDRVLRFDGTAYEEQDAFGNFGIYLIDGEFAGTCVRWSSDFLSTDDAVWTTPVGLREKSLKIEKLAVENRKHIWNEINDELAFKYGYTGGYTGIQESFVLDVLRLDKGTFNELIGATEQISEIFKRTTKLVQDNFELFCPVLGISDTLKSLVTQRFTDSLDFIGRFDWVIDTKGSLKLLEFNSETPAGITESMIFGEVIQKKLGFKGEDPNVNLGHMIVESFKRIINDYSRLKDIRNIGFVSCNYYEDWYNTTAVYRQVKHLPFNFILGEVSGLERKEGKLYLYGTQLDAIYRYYPLDWFDNDPYYSGAIDAFRFNTLSINSPSTYVSQSKAFLALIWELASNGFFDETDVNCIKKYIPKTAMSPKKLDNADYCIKPFFGREGQDVLFKYNKPHLPSVDGELVYQERVDIQSIMLDIHCSTGSCPDIRYPIIGAYVTDGNFSGIYTRAGGRITDKWAVYLPMTVEND